MAVTDTAGIPETMTQAAFAEHLGVNRAYVTRLKRAGRLVMTDDGKRVLVEASKQRIAATRGQRFDVEQRWEDQRGDDGPKPQSAAAPVVVGEPVIDDGADEALDVDSIGLRTRRAAMRKAEADAAIAERKAAADAGEWLARAAVERDLAAAVGVILNAWAGVPDRLSAQLAATTDADTARAILLDEVERVQATVHRELSALAGAADARPLERAA
jgi:hypothetical protein